jgi:hypothetical protein
MIDEKKKRFNLIYCTQAVHAEIVSEANKDGGNLAEYLGHILEAAVEKGLHKADSVTAASDWYQFQKEKRDRDRTYRCAVLYREHPTEATAERLTRMCERTGLDFEGVTQEMEENEFSSLLVNRGVSVLYSSCLLWLYNFLQKHNGSVTVEALAAAAKNNGYSYDMLKRIKSDVNSESALPKILSKKTGSVWSWELQEVQEVA